MSTVYLNGEFIPKDEAKVSVDDRGFLLADGVYEVTPFYEGVPFSLDRHLARLRRGLEWMRIPFDVGVLEEIHNQLIARNDLQAAPTSLVYLQITRGVAPRTHYFPKVTPTPTVYAYAKPWPQRSGVGRIGAGAGWTSRPSASFPTCWPSRRRWTPAPTTPSW